MAGLIKRGNVWFAIWRGNNNKPMQRTTRIKVRSGGLTTRQTRKLAQAQADEMEMIYRKNTIVQNANKIFRAIAEENGLSKPLPTIREYLTTFPALAKPNTEKQRQHAFREFLTWLGKDAELSIADIKSEHIRKYLLHLLQRYRTGTVVRRREFLASAFNRAVKVDEYLYHSPMRDVQLRQLMNSKDIQDDSETREPFTEGEMRKIINDFPQPYRDLAAASFYLGGLRLGDTCMLRWKDVNMDRDVVFVKEQKTGKPRYIHIIAPLRERLLARKEQQEEGEEFVFPETARKYQYSRGTVSTDFTNLLKAFGIATRREDTTALKGGRRHIAVKCFHSIRHTVVSLACSISTLAANVVRETVGHSSDKMLQQYFSAADKSKREVLETLADKVRPESGSDSDSDFPASA